MKRFFNEYRYGIIVGLIVLIVLAYFFYKFQREKVQHLQAQQQISTLKERFNAVTNWQEIFDEDGIKLDKGHRGAYTADIESALIRTDGLPILIVGQIFDVNKKSGRYYLGIRASGYPDLNFLLECQSNHAEQILAQPTDDGEYFAVVAKVESVFRPAFETDALVERTDDGGGAWVIVEPGDQYILRGRCLDISYVGAYE